ncbi:hypothetical protein P22_3388 [Propionispora sp. 2/2-37]|uniref:four-carbon acid sugar kinase family protein n=1 Tax=Propionispora sp. 2/2-37 TaxID=1677858 RepID=UPI0006BB6D6D|nr:four-carbon acid sugar kinase family protein [Propionispora sp. 2/2-37]CUH97261.1 hypothetical protein P22_3388 [Propionispora sp. 2/2-37]
MKKLAKKSVFSKIKEIDVGIVDTELEEALSNLNKKIIVLDDDPTGIQTVHDISVYTDWSTESIAAGFAEEQPMFFILTNSRALTVEQTRMVHKEIAENIVAESKKCGKNFIIISRGDSTLRGHYPLETQILKETLEAASAIRFDGEVLIPFFKEGGRFTIDNVHYVQESQTLVPVGETEFAKDKTFSFAASELGEYIEEKTEGSYKAADTTYITLEDLRNLKIPEISRQLLAVKEFNKVIVNAVDYVDVKIFTIALLQVIAQGKNFMFRTAAAFTKVIGGLNDQELLNKADLVAKGNKNGGLIIVGSHVEKTTHQLAELQKCTDIRFFEFNQGLVVEPEQLETAIQSIIVETEKYLKRGETVTIFTGRKRLDAGTEEESLRLSVKISAALTAIVQRLSVQPSFLIAKGGITSSDVGTKGLNVKKARVMGQVKPGVPVWLTGQEAKFANMPYIIFPGNVGGIMTLREVVEMLNNQ